MLVHIPSGLVGIICLLLCASGGNGVGVGPVSDRVKKMVIGMSLKDKAGQMTEIDIGAVTDYTTTSATLNETKLRHLIRNYRIGSMLNSPLADTPNGPIRGIWNTKQWRKAMRTIQRIAEEEGVLPLIHGLDSVHGANYVANATLFPQQHALGATFNPLFAREMGRVTARDTMAAGIQWIYGPILDLGVNSRWPRMFETFSEDPHVVAMMGAGVITGIQNYSYNGLKSAACMKHFIAYSATTTGRDPSPVLLDKRDVENYFLTPYRAALKAGVKTAMESYQEISGVPMVSSPEYLKDLLRYELGFKGFLVTDYGEINTLHQSHAVAATNIEAVRIAMEDTTIDMSMTPMDTDFTTDLIDLVNKGEVPMWRLDESVERILQTKEDLGLLDHPFDMVLDESPLDKYVGSDEDKAIALDAIRESITLLKNENTILPLDPKKTYNILVVGPTANSLAYQCGGWYVHWHGPLDDAEVPYGTTLYDAISQIASGKSTVDYLLGTNSDGVFVTTKDQLADRAAQADIIIVGVGEPNYSEAPGNIEDLALPQGQHDLITHLAASSTAPIITVLFEGRPRLLGPIPSLSAAVLHGYLPGPSGGLGVAEILFGLVNPSGRLPFTYPKLQNGPTLPYYQKIRQREYNVEWAFGAGLSYTTFAYENLRISPSVVDEKTPFTISMLVRNTGLKAGKHTVLLFGFDIVRRVSPEFKILKTFTKTQALQPGEVETVSFTLDPMEDLSFYGVQRHRILENGEWRFGVGEEIDCRGGNATGCLTLTVRLSDDYLPICDAACTAFGRIHDSCSVLRGTTTTDPSIIGGGNFDSCRRICRQEGDWRWSLVDRLKEIVLEPHTLCGKADIRVSGSTAGSHTSAMESTWKQGFIGSLTVLLALIVGMAFFASRKFFFRGD